MSKGPHAHNRRQPASCRTSLLVRVTRALAVQIALLGLSFAVSSASSAAQNLELSQERERVAAECRRLARPLGLSDSHMEEAAKRATTTAELASVLEECRRDLLAYPTPALLDEPAMERGHDLYKTLGCPVCHGNDARGGESGPSLLRSQRLLRDKKGETIGEVIVNGIPNTRMVAFHLSPEQLADIAAFLHGLQVKHLGATRDEQRLADIGDAKAGEGYFAQKCNQCHSATGDLLAIGSKYQDIKILQQRWLMPDDSSAKSASVLNPDGSVVEGKILHIDEFLVTLRLDNGSRRTLELDRDHSTLQVRDRLESHRKLLQEYSDSDIHNVTAYLHTLVGAGNPGSPASDSSRPSSFSASQRSSTVAGLPLEFTVDPQPGSWPTYSGDYSGRRYSPLSEINPSNVSHLTLAWTAHLDPGATGQTQGGRTQYPVNIGGEGKDDLLANASAEIRGSILQAGGVLYLSTPDNAWAVDARSGEILWNFRWKSRGGWHFFGSRGPAMRNTSIYFETPDDYLVSVDAETGVERWHVPIASLDEQYFASVAPIVIGNHILVGAGNTLNAPGFLESFDPDTGHLQWKHYSVPMNAGDPGIETWKDLDAARHGGGQVWVPGVYDQKTHLYIYGTGNPTPAYVASARGNGDALFTCSLLAVNVDSGKLAWYYQTSPNDTHDWDSAQTPVLAEIMLSGRRREVVMTASRNGYFFVVDRNDGTPLLTKQFSSTLNWAQPQLNRLGQPVRRPEKDGLPGGALVSNDNVGATNWQPPSYSPDYGLFYVQSAESWALSYTTNSDAGGAYSMEGKEEVPIDSNAYLKAIDPKTGQIVWSVKYPSGNPLANGVLTTAGSLLFAGDTAGNLVARDPADGHPLWYSRLGQVSNAPETYMFDGHQFILVASGNMLYSFRLL